MPAVERAAVVPQNWRGENRLVAYIVTSNKHQLDPAQCRKFLLQQLPDFMVPAVFIQLENMPTTPSGKIDRRALPLPSRQRPQIGSNLVSPSNLVESVLAALWADALDLKTVGTADNFFELGGHSLLAGEIVGKINRIFAVDISPQELMEARTIPRLAALLVSRRPHPGDAEKIAQLWSEIEHMEPSLIREALIRERTKSDNVR
jgi:acyl carrier protein